VQCQRADHKVETTIPKWDEVGIGSNSRTIQAAQEVNRCVGGNQTLDPGAAHQSSTERAVMGAKIERSAKFPTDIVKTFD
jgi:hypothetical protein